MSEAKTFYDLSAKTLSGKPLPMSQYKGKVVLIANTASKCGYTPQYKQLQSLHEKYKDKGLVVIGFPSADFGGQEFGSSGEIEQFCKTNYGVTFQLTQSSTIKGAGKNEVFKHLTTHAPSKEEVDWNFEKFLLDKKGNVVERLKSGTKPDDKDFVAKIESLLGV